MTADVLTTFQKGVSLLTSLPLSVSLGFPCLVCIPQTMFIINVTPYVVQGKLPEGLMTWGLFFAQALPVLVLASWAMGILINRTAHVWFGDKKGKPSTPGINFASFQANEAHAFLYPMVGYSLVSAFFVLTMIGFTRFWDDGLSVSFAPQAIVLVLGNLLAWVGILYYYARIILSAPIIVLHRRGVIDAMKTSYKLTEDEATRWEVFALIIVLLILGALLDFLMEVTVLRGIFGNSNNTAMGYCVHFNLLVIILLPLYSRYVATSAQVHRSWCFTLTRSSTFSTPPYSILTAQYYHIKMSEREQRKKRQGDDIGLMGFEVH